MVSDWRSSGPRQKSKRRPDIVGRLRSRKQQVAAEFRSMGSRPRAPASSRGRPAPAARPQKNLQRRDCHRRKHQQIEFRTTGLKTTIGDGGARDESRKQEHRRGQRKCAGRPSIGVMTEGGDLADYEKRVQPAAAALDGFIAQLHDELDNKDGGFWWWKDHLDWKRRVLISDYLIASAQGVSASLIAASLAADDYRLNATADGRALQEALENVRTSKNPPRTSGPMLASRGPTARVRDRKPADHRIMGRTKASSSGLPTATSSTSRSIGTKVEPCCRARPKSAHPDDRWRGVTINRRGPQPPCRRSVLAP